MGLKPFTLDDLREALNLPGPGPLNAMMMRRIPGMMKHLNADPERDKRRMIGLIDAMTPAERRNPLTVTEQSRRRRIAEGAGVRPHEVSELVKQLDRLAALMRRMSGGR
jgi:signal recognition particle subunit SRP54